MIKKYCYNNGCEYWDNNKCNADLIKHFACIYKISKKELKHKRRERK